MFWNGLHIDIDQCLDVRNLNRKKEEQNFLSNQMLSTVRRVMQMIWVLMGPAVL